METPGSPSPLGEMASPDVVTLSEEQLRVSLPVRVSGRVRLVKYVETETVTQMVEVRREKLRIEEAADEPAENDLSAERSAADLSSYSWQQQDFDLILHEEQIEIVKTVVAVEKVQVRTRILTTDEAVSAQVGHEQIELTSTSAGAEVPLGLRSA